MCSWLSFLLDHFYIYRHSAGEIEVRECLYHLRRGVEDIDEALMDAHFKLLARVLVDEGGAVDRPTLNLGREWHGADNDRIKARGGVPVSYTHLTLPTIYSV